TIKLTPVRMNYEKDGVNYTLNLIDTPGHVDFNYEVSRSLAACEGALLVVDASQGVEAQTLANCYLALENDLEIIPVINKIDLPSADVDGTKKEIEDTIGLDASAAPLVSAKEGLNIKDVLDAVVDSVPACASIKTVSDTKVGDTLTDAQNPCKEPLKGYKEVKPMVFCGIFPADGSKYNDLKDALEKLKLNDAALSYEPDTSVALGFG
ncbi:MAG: GTP-binding protein, partial [Clostridia bacterium]|nr:GTP-binding protein [Clostridia bacterium]